LSNGRRREPPYLDGKPICTYEAPADAAAERDLCRNLLRERGLWKPASTEGTIFRQAVAFENKAARPASFREYPAPQGHHVNVVGHQARLFDSALLLLRQFPKHFSEVPSQLRVKYLPPAFWNEYNMIFALHLLWLRLSCSSIVKLPFVRVVAHDRKSRRWATAVNVKPLLPPRQSRGVSRLC
jgi:hypothetical protein